MKRRLLLSSIATLAILAPIAEIPAFAETVVTVAGLTQADIATALNAAGDYGTVIFPTGEYLVSGLRTLKASQRWKFDVGAVLKRGPNGSGVVTGDLLVLDHDLTISGGVFDCNRQGNDASQGIANPAKTLNIFDAVVKNTGGWGIHCYNGSLKCVGVNTLNTGFAGILWETNAFRSVGPIIRDCVITRTIGYVASGGILVINNSNPSNLILGAKIEGNIVTLPQLNFAAAQGYAADAVCIEARGAVNANVTGNSVVYGKIGISFVQGANNKMHANDASACFQYGLELAGGTVYNAMFGNTVQGINGQAAGSANPSRGISISDGSSYSKLVGNVVYGCSVDLGIEAGCVGNTVL